MMDEKKLLSLIGQVSPELIEKTLPETEDISAAPEEKERIMMTNYTEAKRGRAAWLRGGIAAAVVGVLLIGNIALISGLGKIGKGGSSVVTPAASGSEGKTDTLPADPQETLQKKLEEIPDCTGWDLREALLKIPGTDFTVGEELRMECVYVKNDSAADTVLDQKVSLRPENYLNGGRFAPALCVLTVSGGPDCSTVPVTVELPADAMQEANPELILLDRESGILFDGLIDPAEHPDNRFTAEVTGWGIRNLEAFLYTGENDRNDIGTYQVDFTSGNTGTVPVTAGEGFAVSVTESGPDFVSVQIRNTGSQPARFRFGEWTILKNGSPVPEPDNFQQSDFTMPVMQPDETRIHVLFWDKRYGNLEPGSYVLKFNDLQLDFTIEPEESTPAKE